MAGPPHATAPQARIESKIGAIIRYTYPSGELSTFTPYVHLIPGVSRDKRHRSVTELLARRTHGFEGRDTLHAIGQSTSAPYSFLLT
jgi:hypothetical protein